MKRLPMLALTALAIPMVIGLALTVILANAHATPPSGQSTEMLGKGTTADSLLLKAQGIFPNQAAHPWRGTYKAPWDVTSLRITLPPGASTGWHRHAGPGFMVVAQGAVTLYANDCTKTTYTKGQAYVEVPGLANLVRNDGAEPAMFVGTFVVPTTASLRIDVPSAPCNA
ncbi:MAG: cupin domain-containing protein [Gaiellaceae bacterium]